MIVDALILAGGRSSRLGGSGKQKLRMAGSTLLERTVDAVRSAGARRIVVVGDDPVDGATTVRESPAFAGPVAAISAGMRALDTSADAVLVLACDMPGIAAALPDLVDAFAGDGVVAVDGGRPQQLVLAVSPAALTRALAALPTVVDAPVRDLLRHLALREQDVAAGSTDDIDTWDDAVRFGAVAPAPIGG